jgi:hypothetical protein
MCVDHTNKLKSNNISEGRFYFIADFFESLPDRALIENSLIASFDRYGDTTR